MMPIHPLKVYLLFFIYVILPTWSSCFSLDTLENEIPSLRFLKTEDLDRWRAPEEIQKKYPYYLSGFDEDGRPIWVLDFGKWDVRHAVEKGEGYLKNLDKHIDKWIYLMLNSTKLRSTPDNPVGEVVTIVDMNDYSLWQLSSLRTVSFLLRKVRELRDTMLFVDAGYVVNANYMAQMLVGMVRPILGQDMDKIEVYGTTREDWIPILLRKLPRSQLAEAYGGSRGFTPIKFYG